MGILYLFRVERRGSSEARTESRNEYIKWLCGVWLLIKSCKSCTYSIRALMGFLIAKSGKFCGKKNTCSELLRSSMRGLMRFLVAKSGKFWGKINTCSELLRSSMRGLRYESH